MKKMKKVLAVVLTVAFAMSLFSVTAFAAESPIGGHGYRGGEGAPRFGMEQNDRPNAQRRGMMRNDRTNAPRFGMERSGGPGLWGAGC